jgi:hypothetical protein
MSSTSNYNAITNLVETIIDYLIVDTAEINTATIQNLDCNVGTIDTLTSTTASLTSANIPTLTNTTLTNTTSNTTNLNTNNIQANPVSSAVSLYTTHTGTLTLGNTSNSNALTINNNINLPINKSITLDIAGAGLITAPSFRAINSVVSDTINAVASGNTISLYSNSTTAGITLGGGQTTGNIRLGNITPASDSGTLTINKNTTISTGKKITTPDILVSSLTANKLVLSDASDNLVSSLYTDSDFPRLNANNTFTGSNIFSGSTNTFNNTLLCNTITGTTAGSAISLFGTTTSILSFGNLSAINPFTINTDTILGTNKNLSLSTNALLFCNFINATTATTPSCSLFGNATTSIITIGGSLTTPNLTIGNSTMTGIIRLEAGVLVANGRTLTISSPGKLVCDTIESFVGNNVSLYTTANGTISIGFAGGLGITFNDNVIMNTNKNITLSGTGKITTPNILVSGLTASKLVLTDASDNLISSLYDETTLPVSTPQQTALNLKANIASPTFTGIITAPEIRCPLYNSTNATTNMSLGSTSNTANINIGEGQTTGNIVLGHTTPASDSGGLTINKFTTIATGKSLTLSSTSNFISDNIRGTAIGTSTSIYPTTTTGLITIGSAQTSGSVQIGNTTPASDSGTLTINKNTAIATNKTLSCNTIQGTTSGSLINLFSLTTNIISIGGLSTNIALQDNVVLAIGKTLTMTTSGSIINDIYSGIAVGNNISLFSSTTTGNLTLCSGQTSGTLQIGNTTPASDTGGLTINKITTMGTGKDLLFSSTGRIRVDRIVGSTPLTSNINIGYTDGAYTADILLNQDVVVASNRTIISPVYNALSATTLLEIGKTNTTSNINIGQVQTTGNIILGHTTAGSDSGTLTINKNTTLGANKNLTLGSQSIFRGGLNGTANITAGAFTNVILFPFVSVAGFYQVYVYGASSTQTFSVCCFLSADNSGAVQTIANRNMTFQSSGTNWCITATLAPTSTISMSYNVVRLV